MNSEKKEKMYRVFGSWTYFIGDYFDSVLAKQTAAVIQEAETKGKKVYPEKSQRYRAFRMTPPEDVSVVILGQDPYPHEHACGVAFGTNAKKAPASLKNIIAEIEKEYNAVELEKYFDLTLSAWCYQGVLLLNTVLSVEEGSPGSHIGIGWETLTSAALINLLNSEKPSLDHNIVFIVLGKKAEKFIETFVMPALTVYGKSKMITLVTAHPSPYSATSGFLGSGIFKKANEYLPKDRQVNWVKDVKDILPF